MQLNAKVLLFIAVTFLVISIPIMLYTTSPNPEIIGAKQTWVRSGGNDQITDIEPKGGSIDWGKTNITVIVKNNGAEGWVTVYVGYNEFLGRDGNIITVPEGYQKIYLKSGETKVVIFEKEYSLKPRFPLLKYAYAKSSAFGIKSSGWYNPAFYS